MKTNFLKTLGPGILFASTAIGVSHLVQSTRAGAEYGFTLLIAVIAANLFKYPFFEYGSRYASVKKKSIIDGYAGIGKWMLCIYLLITLGTMFFVSAAVCAVTAGFMDNLFGLSSIFGENSSLITNIILLILGAAILIIGKYKTLDSLIKIIGSVLLISTLLAFVLTLINGPASDQTLLSEFTWEKTDMLFLIALMGWMPTAVDLSAWNSLWTIERMEQTKYEPTLKETLFEFNFGYITSAFLSICFITLGAYMMFGTDAKLSNSGASFANQVVGIFTGAIGDWSYFIIATAGFSIMLGTFIAVLDGYSRAMSRTSALLINKKEDSNRSYNTTLLVTLLGSFGLIYYYLFLKADKAGFKGLVDMATTLSFLVAPIIAAVNFKLVMDKNFPEDKKPPVWLKVLSVLGISFLTIFSVVYFIY